MRTDTAFLAHARYPDAPLLLAMMYYASDRRAAGLGALDERLRKGREIVRRKRLDAETGDTFYTVLNNLPPRDVWPKFELGPPLLSHAADECVTITRLPAVRVERWLRVGRRDAEVLGRGYVAELLRRARREVHRETRAAGR